MKYNIEPYPSKMFDYGQCGCMSACEERQPKGEIVQYGNYKDAAKIVRSSRINVENMSAAVVYLAEVRGTVHEEGASRNNSHQKN